MSGSDAAFPPLFPERFNLAHYLLDARLEEGHGDAIALRMVGATLTYADVQAQANALAQRLRDAGVSKGARVLLALVDGPAFAVALFATLKVGAIGAMVNPEAPAAEHAALLAYARPAALLMSPHVAKSAAAAIAQAPSLRLSLVDGPAIAGFASMQGAAAASDAPRVFCNADTHRDDVALWLFTSGSTGQPKAAVHRHRDFAYHIECYAKRVLSLCASDVTLAVPKLHFPYATGMNLMFPFAVGASAILFPEHPTPAGLHHLIRTFAPTVLSTVPTMTAKLLAAGIPAADLQCLRLAVSAGEALPAPLAARWRETFGIPMLDGIGSAEMFHIYISNRPGDTRPGSLGQEVPGYEARVVRADGSPANDGEPGTLWVKGGSSFVGYHGDPEKTQATLRDGWVVSGDFFHRSPDGRFHYGGLVDGAGQQ